MICWLVCLFLLFILTRLSSICWHFNIDVHNLQNLLYCDRAITCRHWRSTDTIKTVMLLVERLNRLLQRFCATVDCSSVDDFVYRPLSLSISIVFFCFVRGSINLAMFNKQAFWMITISNHICKYVIFLNSQKNIVKLVSFVEYYLKMKNTKTFWKHVFEKEG